jgi:nitrate reductase NapAB chaperone NapD
MPVFSYLVIPSAGEMASVRARLSALPGCDVAEAENRELLVLVTESADLAAEAALRQEVENIDGIRALVLTFGEIES